MAGLNEELWIERAQSGDLQAFNQLVLNYQGLAYSVAYGILGDAEEAVDATQDTFLKAYRALGRYWGGSFKAWLMRILTNACYDALRSRKRRRQRISSLDDLLEHPESASLMRDRRPSPQEQAEVGELRQTIQRAMNALPVDQRTVVYMYDVEGLSYEEIAVATGMPMGTVKSRLNRGRAHLRDYLSAYDVATLRQAQAFPKVPPPPRLTPAPVGARGGQPRFRMA